MRIFKYNYYVGIYIKKPNVPIFYIFLYFHRYTSLLTKLIWGPPILMAGNNLLHDIQTLSTMLSVGNVRVYKYCLIHFLSPLLECIFQDRKRKLHKMYLI